MRKFSAFVLTLLLFATPISNFSHAQNASSGIQVSIDGTVQEYDQPPVLENDFTLVPLRGIFESLGAMVNWDATQRKVTAEKDRLKLTLTVGSNIAYKNGLPVKLDAAPKVLNGRTLVPLRFVSESLGADVAWDANKRTVLITTKKMVSNALSYETAVHKAIEHSFALKNAVSDIDRSEELRDQASEKLQFSTPSGSGNGETDALERAALKGLVSANISLEMANKQIEVTKDKVAYAVKQSYNGVQQKERELESAQFAINVAKKQKEIAELQYTQGIISQIELTQAQTNEVEAYNKMLAAEKSLADTTLKFKSLIGSKSSEEVILINAPQYTEIGNVDLDTHIQKIINDSPSMWLLEQQVKLAQMGLDLYTYNAGQDPYEVKKIDLSKAQINLQDYKKKLDDNIHSMYYQIKQLEDQYQVLQANLAKAEQALQLAKINVETGRGIQLEVVKSELAVAQLQQQIFGVIVSLDNLHLAFEKPWAIQ